MALADQAAVAAALYGRGQQRRRGPVQQHRLPAATTCGLIGVGGTTTYRESFTALTTRDCILLSPGGWEAHNITALSSGGITEFNPHTVDAVAPWDRGWSLCSSDTTNFFGCADIDQGTSRRPRSGQPCVRARWAPWTSGTAALVIEAYRKTHCGDALSPALVERIIVSTATDLGAPADDQGAGLVNTLKAVQLAESINSNSPQGSTLLVNKTSLNATVNAGQPVTFSVSVTPKGTGIPDGHPNRARPPRRGTPLSTGAPST